MKISKSLKIVLPVLFIALPLFGAGRVDAYIICDESQKDLLEDTIRGIHRHLQDLNQVYVISKEHYTRFARWIPHTNFPFAPSKIAQAMKFKTKKRKANEELITALYKDLLGFYAPFINEVSRDVVYVTKAGQNLVQDFACCDRNMDLYNDFTTGDFDQQEKAPIPA